MPDRSPLGQLVEAFLSQLAVENASPHTLRNYRIDLEQFVAYFSPEGAPPPDLASLDLLALREWLAALHQTGLSKVTLRRKLAAVRSFFRQMHREGRVAVNLAKLLRTPRAPQTLPAVMTEEQTNRLVDCVGARELERPFPERDTALFEVLYGCGVRVSELVGLDLEALDLSDRWIRVLGKGRKERQVPLGSKAAEAIERYLTVRRPKDPLERALFLNWRGSRLGARGARSIVKLYATLLSGDSSVHPHSFRHAYATHLLAGGADLRSIQELLGHAQLSTTQKYTQVALADLMAVYDKAHPKA